jgi:hypothetical protein
MESTVVDGLRPCRTLTVNAPANVTPATTKANNSAVERDITGQLSSKRNETCRGARTMSLSLGFNFKLQRYCVYHIVRGLCIKGLEAFSFI